MEAKYYLTTKKGLFYYSLWENSNFLGNNPRQWYLFARDRAAVFSTIEEAKEHKKVLLQRIAKQGADYINNHLKKYPQFESHIPEHENKIKRVLNYFNNLEISEKIISLTN
jgi:hypothetical protein